MRERAVVTAFIAQRNGEEITKILLFKRSTGVRTYKEHWASCSGSIEPGDPFPLERAWAELREETGLTVEELDLLCSGESQTLVDAGLDTQWTIYPFLFEMKTPDFETRVKIDWEHSEFRWIHPKDLSVYQTVPSLEETLRHVTSPNRWNTVKGAS